MNKLLATLLGVFILSSFTGCYYETDADTKQFRAPPILREKAARCGGGMTMIPSGSTGLGKMIAVPRACGPVMRVYRSGGTGPMMQMPYPSGGTGPMMPMAYPSGGTGPMMPMAYPSGGTGPMTPMSGFIPGAGMPYPSGGTGS